jgi:hypothetical protein
MVIGAQLGGGLGPVREHVPVLRRLLVVLDLGDAVGTLTDARADTITARIATTDNHHVQALGIDAGHRVQRQPGDAPVLLFQILHGEVDAAKGAPRHYNLPRYLAAAGEHYRVPGATQLAQVAHRSGGPKHHALGAHLRKTAVQNTFVQAEVGDTVTQQPADAVGLLEHLDSVAGTAHLLSASETRRTGAHNGDMTARLREPTHGPDPPRLPGMLRYGQLDILDADRGVADPQGACVLTGGGTEAPRKLREIVRGVQLIVGAAPLALVDQGIPLRDQIVHGTAGVTVWSTAIHAAVRLAPGLGLGHEADILAPVPQATEYALLAWGLPVIAQEAVGICHRAPRTRRLIS